MEITARLTGDATVTSTKNERQVVNFSVAINDSYKANGTNEITKITTYFQCDYWGNSGIAPYLIKGSLVELYGRIGVKAYNGKNGEAKAALTFHVYRIKLHGKGKQEAGKTGQAASGEAAAITETMDDLPF